MSMHLQRQRYILFEYFCSHTTILSEKDIIRTIWKTLLRVFGEYTAYKTGLWMIEYDSSLHYGILRCNNITQDRIIATLALISKIKNQKILFHSIKTSATIKKIKQIQKQYFERHR